MNNASHLRRGESTILRSKIFVFSLRLVWFLAFTFHSADHGSVSFQTKEANMGHIVVSLLSRRQIYMFFFSLDSVPHTLSSFWFRAGSRTKSWRPSLRFDPGNGFQLLFTGLWESLVAVKLLKHRHGLDLDSDLWSPFRHLHADFMLTLYKTNFVPPRHPSTGAVIGRCGQPEVSWWGWRNADDEQLVQSISKACALDPAAIKPLSNGHLHTNGTHSSSGQYRSLFGGWILTSKEV